MLSGPWVYAVAAVAAFVLATLASPVGVSGAVLLLPFQVSVLGTPSPAVTPTNLLYNIVATPGACIATGVSTKQAGRSPASCSSGQSQVSLSERSFASNSFPAHAPLTPSSPSC